MASGVFGIPITEETVRSTGEYKEPITQRDVADYAMKMVYNSSENYINAQKFVDNLKSRYGSGITTKCLIYNATGTTLSLVDYHDWHGTVYDSPYPTEIQNGQWGAFIHVHPTGRMEGSSGAVVYRSKIPSSNEFCDWLFCWSIPFIGPNSAYTEIREEGHYKPHWNYIHHSKLEQSGRSSTDDCYGYRSKVDISHGTTASARAIFELRH